MTTIGAEDLAGGLLPPGVEPGPFDDLEIKEPPDRTQREKRKDNETPKAGPPRLDEWQDFFARVLIKGLTERYINFVFRDVDEDELSDREIVRMYLTEEERDRIARPFSELANKAQFTRKHGRVIIAASDSVDSVFTLGIWFSRVNRIAAKHRKPKAKVIHREEAQPADVRFGPYEANGTDWKTPTGGGFEFGESPGTG